ncbi:MAG: hypothetical protein WB502_13935 [Thermoactinomyces sp.]
MMETAIMITNGLSGFAFFAFLGLVVMIAREGKDERARFLGYKLFNFLFVFLFGGLSIIIFYTGWVDVEYKVLRVSITTLFSLTIFSGLIYWMAIRKKY